MTQRGVIHYANLPHGRSIIFLQAAEEVFGETLCKFSEARRTIQAVLDSLE